MIGMMRYIPRGKRNRARQFLMIAAPVLIVHTGMLLYRGEWGAAALAGACLLMGWGQAHIISRYNYWPKYMNEPGGVETGEGILDEMRANMREMNLSMAQQTFLLERAEAIMTLEREHRYEERAAFQGIIADMGDTMTTMHQEYQLQGERK